MSARAKGRLRRTVGKRATRPTATRCSPFSVATVLGAFALLGLVVLTVVGTSTELMKVNDAVSVLASLCFAAPLCLRAWWRSRGAMRVTWLLLAGASTLWGFGEALWGLSEAVLGQQVASPSIADIGYLGGVVVALAAVALFPARQLLKGDRLRAVVDGLLVSSSLLFISWATALGAAFHGSVSSGWGRVVNVAYPTADVAVATVLITVAARAGGRRRWPLMLLITSMFAQAFADSVFVVLSAHGSYETGNPIDLLWIVAYLLIGLAALHPAAVADDDELSADAPAATTSALAYLPVSAAAVVAAARLANGSGFDAVLTATALTSVLLLLVRQWMTLRRNVNLNHQLRVTVELLEAHKGELAWQMLHDPLTGAGNRTMFHRRMQESLASRRSTGGPVSVLFCDLDDFKAINDTLGHDAGDAVLVGAAERLRASLRSGDTLARLGGDEFGILLAEATGEAAATAIADRIIASFTAPFAVRDREVSVGISVGITVNHTGPTGDEILRDADLAMYEAKAGGKGRVVRSHEPTRENALSGGGSPNAE
ncbi:MAG: Diguanylate cyclase/phosphodiesterase [Acidimicrobiia bacterium]|nr:Diguanylate cyclase/phosphodiesterase [Acidimicrobiia bacterium]